VGAEAVEDDGEPFEEKMERLTGALSEKLKEHARLVEQTRSLLRGIGYEI
jgi:type I restriction enzyme M protein